MRRRRSEKNADSEFKIPADDSESYVTFIPRRVYSSWEATPAAWRAVLVHILVNATRQRGRFRDRTLQPGQFGFSLASLARSVGVSVDQTRSALRYMQETRLCTIETTNRFSILSVLDWHIYDGSIEHGNQPNNRTESQSGDRNGSVQNQKGTVSAPPESVVQSAEISEERETDPDGISAGGALDLAPAKEPPAENSPAPSAAGQQIATILRMGMRFGAPLPDFEIVDQVAKILRGATMSELMAAVVSRKKEGVPASYGDLVTYLQNALAPSTRKAFRVIQPPAEPPPQSAALCASCRETGVIGGRVEGVSPEYVLRAVRAGGRLCGCAMGDRWREHFANNFAADDLPVIQREPAAAAGGYRG